MPPTEFKTLSTDLADQMPAVVKYLRERGYKLTAEPAQLGCPYTPALRARRETTTVFHEVSKAVDRDRLEQWVSYAKAQSHDCRVSVATLSATPEDREFLEKRGIGLIRLVDSPPHEDLAARDQTVNISLPPLASQPARARTRLGASYDRFERGAWKEGFDDSCQVLESEARKYLANGVQAGRIVLTRRKKAPVSVKEVNRMTMGQLAVAFAQITNQNHADSLVGKTLKSINATRILMVHKRRQPGAEARLKRKVPNLMWQIVPAVSTLCS